MDGDSLTIGLVIMMCRRATRKGLSDGAAKGHAMA